MALSRPYILALIGAVLVVATFASMRSAGDRAQADQLSTKPAFSPPATKGAATKKAPATGTPAAKAKDQAATKAAPAKTEAEPKAKAKPRPKAKPAVTGVPPKVDRALKAGRTVVLFFRQPGADDDATQRAVRSLKGEKRVSVFSDGINHLSRYRRVVSTLGITQAPSLVVVGKSRKAVLLEGFIDEGTLKQRVRDAR